MIGVVLLIFTFLSAYGFLTQSLSIVTSEDLVQTFGEALAPLIATCIRIMYLGVMGWIGSLLTVRGVTLIAHAPKEPKVIKSKKAELVPKKAKTQKPKPQPSKTTAKKPQVEARPKEKLEGPEPEVIFIPPEQDTHPQIPQEQRQENNSSQHQSMA
jgi:hypothetical protein